MAKKDYEKHFGTLSAVVPNTVSRYLKVGDRAWNQVTFQSGKPVLDAELNFLNDAIAEVRSLASSIPSGFLRGQTHRDTFTDFSFISTPNRVRMARNTAIVAGMPVVVEFTGINIPGLNEITLQVPTVYDGTAGTIKRTDFLFLEVWLAPVAPSPRAQGTVQVVNPSDGETVTIDGLVLTTKAIPAAPTDFAIGGNNIITATNLAAAVSLNSVTVAAENNGTDLVTLTAITGGVAGNAILISTSNPATFVLSGPSLAGGADRPNKPAQDKIYHHGNTETPSSVWLDDTLADPILVHETAQRVQVQYRIRTTGATEGVNYKTHPDGFSNTANVIYAQGAKSAPVTAYPFVRADGSSAWANSDAAAYGILDNGLWVAGNGISASATALDTLDGFVYAIPILFAFRHNDCSDAAAPVKGFDPVNNTNGAPLSNHGGYAGVVGPVPAGVSDRPDDRFADYIYDNTLLDLRRHVCISDLDLASELTYQLQSLMDGRLRTWAIDTASKQTLGNGSGDVSIRPLVCNEIGRLAAQGGNPPASGDTDRGESIRNFDHLARRFGSQAVVERVVFAFWPGDRPTAVAQGGPVAPGLENPGKYAVKAEDPPGVPITDRWYENDEIHIDLTQFDATTMGGIFQGGVWIPSGVGLPATDVQTFFPLGATISDVVSIYHDDGNWFAAVDQTVQPATITGLGTPQVVVTLDANDILVTGGRDDAAYKLVASAPAESSSERRIFFEVEVTYPLGAGLTDTPDEFVDPNDLAPGYLAYPDGNYPVLENDGTQRPADSANEDMAIGFREGYREINLQYAAGDEADPTDPIGTSSTENVVSIDRQTLRFPRRVYGSSLPSVVELEDAETSAPVPVDYTTTEFGSSSRIVRANPASFLSGLGQTACDIKYFAQDPIPNYGPSGGGYQLASYFRSNAPQTAGVQEGNIINTAGGTLPTVLRVEPLTVSENLWSGQVGMGSVDLPFPYVAPLDQIPMFDGSVTDPNFIAGTTKEWYFAATAGISVAEFNANVGLVSLHPFIKIDGTDILTIGGPAAGEFPVKDAEFRAFYPYTDDQAYRPTAMTQSLSGAVRHKAYTAILGRVVEDNPGVAGGVLFRTDEVLLIVFNRFAELDENNDIRFIDTDNRTCAGIYRTRNLLLISR